MRSKEQIAVLHDLFNQINDRLGIIGETPDAYFLCQCVEILKQQGATIDAQATSITELEAQLTHLQEVAAIQHEFEEICEHEIGCGITPDGLRDWVAVNKAQLADAKKDAERYQWLCDKGYNYHGAMAGTGSMSICRGPYILLEPPSHNKFSNMILGKPAADAIIDAAIAEGNQA